MQINVVSKENKYGDEVLGVAIPPEIFREIPGVSYIPDLNQEMGLLTIWEDGSFDTALHEGQELLGPIA